VLIAGAKMNFGISRHFFKKNQFVPSLETKIEIMILTVDVGILELKPLFLRNPPWILFYEKNFKTTLKTF
jgi:hypothetical protein